MDRKSNIDSKNLEILLVEDDLIYAEMILEVLDKSRDEEILTNHVSSLKSAQDFLNKNKVAAILLDLTLPDSDGLNTFYRIDAIANEMPLIVLTGMDDEQMAIEAVQAGAQDYLVKNQLNYNSLFRSIRYSIERKQIQEDLRIAKIQTEKANIALLEKNELLKKSIEETKRMAAAAQIASAAKSEFLDNISDELRTPLTAIIGFCELLLEESSALNEDIFNPDLKHIHSESKKLLELINRIIDFSKIEHGSIEIELREIDIKELIQEAILAIRHLDDTINSNIELKFQGTVGLVVLDAVKVKNLLINLLSNACKFTNDGKISLTTFLSENDETKWINFEISDTGIGLSKEKLNDIFQSFKQCTDLSSHRYQGIGLGLSISQIYCQMMGGKIQVTNEEGNGAIFTVKIPLDLDGY